MPVRIAAIGLGNRTCKYLQFVKDHPERVVLTAVVEPDAERIENVAAQFGLPSDRCFRDASLFFGGRRDYVDAVIIGSPDHTHYRYALQSMAFGYHILLEKPIGINELECRDLATRVSVSKVLVSTCYVLRYNPYYEKLKELSSDPALGKVVSFEHTVNVGLDRTTHSYVRGPWNLREMDCTMFLSKCCHDVDIALWILGGKAVKVLSHGSSSLFTASNAPEGSTDRCLDCPAESGCPYSAVDLYWRRRDWIQGFCHRKDMSVEDAIMAELREGRYGRCAFKCYNDAINHQTVHFEMKNGSTATINMESLTNDDNRVTVIRFMGGVISGDEKTIRVHYFSGKPDEVYDFGDVFHKPFHGNADLKTVEGFISAVEACGTPEASVSGPGIRTDIAESFMSHLICFAAEESRKENRTIYCI